MSDPTQQSDDENWIEKAKEDLEEIGKEIDTAKNEFAAEHKKVETFIDGIGNDEADEDAADEAMP
jgi:hypothetical protein